MKFEFGTVFRPTKNHEAADAMTRLQQKASNNETKIADVDDNFPAYCVVGQTSKPNSMYSETKMR